MGMFDDIKYEAPCPICGTHLKLWQSKSGGCGMQNITPSELWEQRYDDVAAIVPERVDFYQDCGKCGTWVEISLSPGLLEMNQDDYRRMRNREPSLRRSGPVIPARLSGQVPTEEPR